MLSVIDIYAKLMRPVTLAFDRATVKVLRHKKGNIRVEYFYHIAVVRYDENGNVVESRAFTRGFIKPTRLSDVTADIKEIDVKGRSADKTGGKALYYEKFRQK